MGDIQGAANPAFEVREGFLEEVAWNLGVVLQLVMSLL